MQTFTYVLGSKDALTAMLLLKLDSSATLKVVKECESHQNSICTTKQRSAERF